MAVSLKGFHIELYQEYLEEASFLYEQRLTLFDDPEITWLDIEDFEERFEPHIDGLVVGDALALEVCRQQCEEGDFGELHAAVRVFCRQKRWDLIQSVLDGLDFEDEERVKAVIDALSQELPSEWEPRILEMLKANETGRIRIAAHVIGFRRISAGEALMDLVERDDSKTLVTVIWALGRLREKNAGSLLLKRLQHGDAVTNPAVALALLRMGDPQALNECLQHIQTEEWPVLPLALCGGRSEAAFLTDRLAERSGPDVVMGIGLLGEVPDIEKLLEALGDPESAEFASIALNLVTGAELFQEIFVPEEMDPDELFDYEIEKLEQGENLYPPGEEPGTTLLVPARDQGAWSRWWAKNQTRFQNGIRYRNGEPYSPQCLLNNLKSENSPHLVRQLAYEELVIRYGIDFPFETDMPVAQQQSGISDFEAWIEANGTRFHSGKWYFAGRLMTN